MKKIFLSLLALGALAMTSCSSKTSETEALDEGAAIKAKIENCTDPDSLKIYVQQAKDYAAKLEKEGDESAAKAYLDEVAPVVKEKDPSVAAIFEALEAKADSAATAVTEKADSLKDAATDAVNAKVEEGKEKVNQAVNDAKDNAAAAVDKAKEKTAEAAQSATDKLKGALGK
ncbi:MAG: hypothetical protein K2L97_07890 [Muribaculaceae bacterium]|nr:hypothetical protein [Muribaculaceae bacterium]